MGIAAILLAVAKLNPEILEFLRKGQRLEAIKHYRLEMSKAVGHDVGLLAAKLYVDKLAADNGILPRQIQHPYACAAPKWSPTPPPDDDEEGSIWDEI